MMLDFLPQTYTVSIGLRFLIFSIFVVISSKLNAINILRFLFGFIQASFNRSNIHYVSDLYFHVFLLVIYTMVCNYLLYKDMFL